MTAAIRAAGWDVGLFRHQLRRLADAPPTVAISEWRSAPADNFHRENPRTLVMKPHKKTRARAMAGQHRRPRHGEVMIHVPLRAADAKRSVKNILQWNCYLPSDCVRTMVRMGWDYTT